MCGAAGYKAPPLLGWKSGRNEASQACPTAGLSVSSVFSAVKFVVVGVLWAVHSTSVVNPRFSKRTNQASLEQMKFVTTLDRDEDGVWIAECPSIPGCVSQGKTREEAMLNIQEAIAACLEVRAERGMPLTIETQQVEVSI